MFKSMAATALAAVLLAGCGDDATPATPPASASAAPETTSAPMAEDPALIAAVKQSVVADGDACSLPDGVDREATQVDLGGGATGVVVLCMPGNVDRWRRLYVRTGSGEAQLQSMLVYDLEGDEQWHAHTEIPELQWDAATKTFTGATSLQATGCGWTGRWRWDGSRMALVEMKRVGCERDGQPDKTWWPTTPPTTEPAAVPIPVHEPEPTEPG